LFFLVAWRWALPAGATGRPPVPPGEQHQPAGWTSPPIADTASLFACS